MSLPFSSTLYGSALITSSPKLFCLCTGIAALLATHDDPFFEQPLPFLGGQPARQLWRTAARRIGATPVHKQDGFADEVVATELDSVLNRGKDIRSALADAQRLLQRRAHR